MATQIGLLNVRRSVLIDASPARVWDEFSTSARVMTWLNQGHTLHTFDPRLGGLIDMSVTHGVGTGSEQRHYGGPIIAFDPAREVTATINWRKPHDWPVPMLWTFLLTPLYDGTLVEIFHHGFERLGREAARQHEGYEEGWTNRHLKTLRAIVEG